MYSPLVPFTDLIDDIADLTGITNMDNIRPKIRRLMFKVSQDLGFGFGAAIKRIEYSVENGTIDNTVTPNRIRLPQDIMRIEEVGMCKDGICPGDYIIQGNYLFLCKEGVTKFNFIYWTLMCDGEGNPVFDENQRQAVVSGVSWHLARTLYRQRKMGRATYLDIREEYNRELGEAIGNSVWPDSRKQWAQLGRILQYSHRDAIIYMDEDKCYCCVPISENPEENNQTGDVVYYWQFEDLTTDIGFAPSIDQNYLDTKTFATINTFTDGFVVPYSNIGRIAFAIQNIAEDYYQLQDIFGNDITDVVFDKYYNLEMNTQIFISKTIYTHGNIFFKFVQNP